MRVTSTEQYRKAACVSGAVVVVAVATVWQGEPGASAQGLRTIGIAVAAHAGAVGFASFVAGRFSDRTDAPTVPIVATLPRGWEAPRLGGPLCSFVRTSSLPPDGAALARAPKRGPPGLA